MHAFVFDIDNTLTPPRRAVTAEMAEALRELDRPFHLAAGSDLPLVAAQLLEPLHGFGFRGSFDAFVSNGSHRFRCQLADQLLVREVFEFRLRDHLGEAAFASVLARLEQILEEPEFALDDPSIRPCGPRLIDRGGMINLAPIGRPAQMTDEAFRSREAFVAFDAATSYRQRMMGRLNHVLAPWRDGKGLKVCLGGQTSFDIVVAGYDKRFPLSQLLAEGYRRLTYVGDALHEGGNDATVLEFLRDWSSPEPCPVDVRRVNEWTDTLAFLREFRRPL